MKLEDSRVYATNAVVEDGDNCYAAYDPNTGNIEVAYDVRDVMCRKLLHEIVHKACHGMSGRDASDIFGVCSPEQRHEREESLCCFMEGKLYDVLTKAGLLRFPKPPVKP